MASDPKNQKKDSSKLMLILAAGGGLVVVIGIVIAILNTYTEVFEDALKPEPRKKPKKTMDFAKPKDASDNTPAKKFTDEVMEAYPNLLQVSAQITLGSSCSAQTPYVLARCTFHTTRLVSTCTRYVGSSSSLSWLCLWSHLDLMAPPKLVWSLAQAK